MRVKFLCSVLLLFVCTALHAQFTLSGTVVSVTGEEPVTDGFVILDHKKTVQTSANGTFRFTGLPAGKYVLVIKSHDFKTQKDTVELTGDTELSFRLHPRNESLKEVVVDDSRSDFSRTRMRGVENMGIYEGKKSEVIVVDQLTANLSTNNARQIYSRVPGLNIWENEGIGLQLSIGGRGLDPNRSSNFNVRQNGYDISADALGYPESYYTPSIETVNRIQIVRGAASLQFGSQFGGLVNFILKAPNPNRKLEVTARQTVGSFNFYNAFTSVSGTVGKVSYYTFFQYKKSDGWRQNSHAENYNAYANVNYQVTEKTSVGIDLTVTNYLAQQPGGLSYTMFKEDPRQSIRERNWFQVNWNLAAVHLDHKFSESSEFNLRVFGLYANRYSLGFRPNRVSTIDFGVQPRDLIKGQFTNFGTEARFLHRYELFGRRSVLLLGSRYYYGFNHSQQGEGSTGSDANFSFVNPEQFMTYDYRFPNQNVALFAENILYLNDRLSITPGIRSEFIDTKAQGTYFFITRDIAGNIDPIVRINEKRTDVRRFLLGGVGVSYKPLEKIELYANISQNYRSITFSDMRVNNPSAVIDQNLKDEKGYSADLGIRSNNTSVLNYDLGVFYLNYNNRIGEIQASKGFQVYRLRTNIGQAIIMGVESYGELDVIRALRPNQETWSGLVFGNIAAIKSEYTRSLATGVTGNQVEFVPDWNIKTGVRLAYKKIKVSFQLTYLSDQFTDATNAVYEDPSSIIGVIPAYQVMDVSMSYEWRRYRLEGSLNNLANQYYFTRRATGYPGPGILPSDGRSLYVTFQVKI
ncbi:MAG: TonB-dependent receptor [Bacteroidota bacterium]